MSIEPKLHLKQVNGVLDRTYAEQRLKKKYLKFRYQERSLVSTFVIKKYISKTADFTLVDFGAAEGRTLMEISRILGEGSYIGIEYDLSLIKSAPQLPSNVKLLQGDVT